ncbi:ATP-dependent DNA helicase [Neobittarella massiliensis]|uniref:ATP-dependent DNA helicase n=1 Tax=Neobittarella massiliensis (ex Bilen et al. 2018) TaxID=2041842 RepID=UPI001FB34AF7|nr:ATP-dependent DNA helicase [Neobittarella massiliensis]
MPALRQIKLPVKKLVAMTAQCGSIDSRYTGPDRAAEGSRIHRRLQRQAGDDYQAEVALRIDVAHGGFLFTVEGRADGIFEQDGQFTVDEIKTTAVSFELLHEDFDPMHWAQAMCYAHIYCRQNELPGMGVQLTYYQIDTRQVRRFQRTYTALQLEEYFVGLLEKYRVWAQFQLDWSALRDQSIRDLSFPFANYRPGQRQLAVAVYRTVQAGSRLYCQAPTGIGKTASTLFPAFKSLGEGLCEKIFYLTAKNTTAGAALQAVEHMAAGGLRAKTVALTAKDKICFLEERHCDPDHCPYADGHYDRAGDALYQLLQQHDHITRQVLEDTARQNRVCPFELGLDCSLWCDCIIGDYNYLFDPTVALKRFFADDGGPYVFLIDEAHNLPDRAREMYSARLRKSDLLQLRRQLGKEQRQLFRALGKVNTALVARRKQCQEQGGGYTQKRQDEELISLLQGCSASCAQWLEEHRGHALEQPVLEQYFAIEDYLRTASLFDERYILLVRAFGSEVVVQQLCLDPAHLLQQAMKKGRAAVLFSATFSPLSFYAQVLGADERSKKYQLPSPFPRKNLCLLVNGALSTRYQHRQQSAPAVADCIAAVAGGRPGHYMVYFPSYSYLQQVSDLFGAQYPHIPQLCQQPGMDEEARTAFLQRFDSGGDTLVGFCVLGGVFGEGIDLVGDRLIGTVIVGVGLPQLGTELDAMRDYYDQKNRQGFAFAYQFPGMNKVLQAAGRVIRDERDRGVVLLIDDRFLSPRYQMLFPAHWQGFARADSVEAISGAVQAFWQPPASGGNQSGG